MVTKFDFIEKEYLKKIEKSIEDKLSEALEEFSRCPSKSIRLFLSGITAELLRESTKNHIKKILVEKHKFNESDIISISKSSDTFPCIMIDIKLT